MLKCLRSVNKLFSKFSSEIWQYIKLVFYKSISVWPIAQNKIITELEQIVICITRLENAILQVQARFVEQRRRPRLH
jgi:hypothetical protein